MSSDKLSLSVLIEDDQVFEEEYVSKQKLKVILNKAKAKLNIDLEDRTLRREDGTPLEDLTQTIEETGIRDGETLRLFKKVKDKPDRDKGFA